MPEQNDIQKALLDFSATIKAKPDLSTKEILQKFPEFDNQAFKINAAKDYAKTLASKKYKTTEELNFKFPEFFGEKEKTQKVAKEEQATIPSMSEMPKLKYEELFSKEIVPIVDKVYEKNSANIVNQEKLTSLLPKIKEQKIKDLTINTLLSKGELAMEGSNTYNNVYADIKNNIPDEQWMPSWTPTSAKIKFSTEVAKQQNEVIDNFAKSVEETPEEVKEKIKNGDYEFDYKKNKVVKKGGFGDMAAYGLNNFFDKYRLFIDASAAQERSKNKGNDNELKYVINQYQNLKKNQIEYTPYGRSDIEKHANGVGEMVGELGPYALIGPTGMSGVVMGIQTGGGAIEDIINQPGTLDEKVARIKNQTTDQFMLGLAQDAAFKLIHVNSRNSAKELMAGYGPTKNLFNTFKEVLRVAPSDAVKAGIVGASAHVIDNLYKKNDGMNVQWDIPQAFISGAALDLMLKSGSVLTHGFSVIKNALKFNIDKSNPEWFNKYSYNNQEVLNHIVSSPNNVYEKIVEMLDQHPSEDATLAKEKIEAFRSHYNSLPKELSKQSKFDALHLLQMKTEALAEANSAADATLKKALLKKADAVDAMLQMVLDGEKINKKEPLLLPRFAEAYNREDNEVKQYGFKDAEEFKNAFNKRQGKDYKTYGDIPEEEKTQFTSELVPLEQPKIDTTMPDWFDTPTEYKTDTGVSIEGGGTYYSNIINEFPELHKFLSSTRKKFNDKFSYKDIDPNTYLEYENVANLGPLVHTSMVMDSKDLLLQIKAAEQYEKLLSYFGDQSKKMSPEDVKGLLEKPAYRGEDKFTPEEVEIMQGMVDRLKGKGLFLYTPSATNAQNFYSFSRNILKAKKPDAFIHEIGHWGYFNMLTPEDRIEFLRYMSNRFGTTTKGRAEELVFGKGIGADKGGQTMTTNAMWDFNEYFADQFRQYYYNNVLPEPKLRTMFERVKDFVNTLLGLYKEKGYNKELTKYFDKIIDISKVEGEGIPIGKEGAKEKIGKKRVEPLWSEDPKKQKQEVKKQNEIAKSYYKEFPEVKGDSFISSITSDETGHYSNIKIALKDTKTLQASSPEHIEKVKEWAKSNGLEYTSTTNENGYNTLYFRSRIGDVKIIEEVNIPEDVKQANIQKATPEDLQTEFQKIKEKNDARTTTGGITEIPTRPTGGVPSELESATKPFRTNESTDGEVSAVNEWAKSKYASEGELDADYGARGLAKYKQSREEFLRSKFCK